MENVYFNGNFVRKEIYDSILSETILFLQVY